MRYIHQHISHIITHYKGEMPLANFLKFYFKKHPILGSRDRKMISEMAYCFYRCAKGLIPKSISADSHLAQLTKLLPERLQTLYGKGFEENINSLNPLGIHFDSEHLLPEKVSLSEGIHREEWLKSILRRPKLFIRIVPKFKAEALRLLEEACLSFEEIDEHCFALPNGSTIEKVLPEKMYRIQDASSQKTGRYFKIKDEETCWDCCSGAGGKSLLVKDLTPNSTLCVSDVRRSILDNLAERFQLYNHPIPERLVLSVANKKQTKTVLGDRLFDHIIADVPCSGSGTWARTPEQLYFFNTDGINDFAQRQKDIVLNAIQYLKPGGNFIYITCSIFMAENENVLEEILAQNSNVILLEKKLINGISMAADSMFVAVIEKKKTAPFVSQTAPLHP
jgi:16S rRNA (cytosine967-C5)-methyltransferase